MKIHRNTSEMREQRRTARLAADYKRKGYEVIREPTINGHRADLVVKKGDQTIFIEVKSSASLRAQKESVTKLAEHVASVPGARFDLVLTNPKRSRSTKSSRLSKK